MSIILKMVSLILKNMSPQFKETIIAGLKTWKQQAAETNNPWDDLVVDFLLYLITGE